jgi:hypothetical protein
VDTHKDDQEGGGKEAVVANELGSFIAAEVTRAETDYKNVRDRALSIVGVAGGLVTLVSGFLAIAAGEKKDFLPSEGRSVLIAALVAYVVSAVLALLVNRPQGVAVADETYLETSAKDNWGERDWEQKVAVVSATYLVSLRHANTQATKLLLGAILFEIGGIAMTAIMAMTIVGHLS